MKKTLASAVMAAWILTGGLASLGKAAAAASSDGPARITVNVRNYAQLDRKTLVRAGEVARGLLQKAGVEVTVTVLAPEEAYLEGAAQGSLNLSIKIMSREMTEKLRLPSTLMGLAPGEERERTEAFVFAQRAADLARQQTDAGLAEILGHALAHEIGHLFNLTHCPQGIMHGDWDKHDLKEMAMGRLNFSPRQAEQIRAEAVRRTRRSPSEEMASLR
jgi:hypothetical protein